jgi:hypothetical protein
MKIEGKTVHDAKRQLTIAVTKADVGKSKRKDPSGCAVAVAVKRATHAHKVLIHKSRAYVQMKPDAEWSRYEVGTDILSELVSFDRGAGFQADDYVLRPPRPSATTEALALRSATTEALALRHEREKKRSRPAYTGKKRNPPHIIKGIRIDAPRGGGR